MGSLSLALLFFALGIVLVSFAFQNLHQKRDIMLGEGEGPYMMRIIDDPSEGSFGYSATALVWNPESGLMGRLFDSCKVYFRIL